ncbi:MAG: hypothetical protein U0984_19680 [Prosthecobacter sp.]|nr:hypothetical protein [Prosthecobacter sp.]
MKFILACFLGAVVSFGWGFVSWTQLGWHEAGMHSFKDETAVAAVIKANATRGRGIYVLPGIDTPLSYATPEDKQKTTDAHNKAMTEGPYMYAIVRPGRADWDMKRNMLLGLARSLLACAIMAALLGQTVLSYTGRVAFTAGAGVFASLVCDAQLWIWFESPAREFMVNVADHFIEWLLVGAVLGVWVGKVPTANDYR